MSVAGQRSRLPDDAYYTPAWCVRILFESCVPELVDLSAILDPCAGDGAILESSPEVLLYAHELRAEERPRLESVCGDPERVSIGDVRELDFSVLPSSCAVVANLPFDLADEIVPLILQSPGPVALLFRANWLYPQKRQGIPLPTRILGLSKRPAFAAFCLGIPRILSPTGKKIKSCGRTYTLPLLHVGPCECGGRVGKQTDACDYAWHIWTAEPSREGPRSPALFALADLAACRLLEKESTL